MQKATLLLVTFAILAFGQGQPVDEHARIVEGQPAEFGKSIS